MNSVETPTTSSTVGLVLEPLDVLFFRDGRPFGQAGQARSMSMPLPQTLAGAVWTALLDAHGCPFGELTRAIRQTPSFPAALQQLGLPQWLASVEVRGPYLARRSYGDHSLRSLELLFPMPANLVRGDDESTPQTLLPLPDDACPPGWSSTRSGKLGWRPLWRRKREKSKMIPGFLTAKGMGEYLSGKPVPADAIVDSSKLVQLDQRTGIGVDSQSQTAQDQLIYSATFLSLANDPRLEYEAVFYAEVVFPGDCDSPTWPDSASTMAFGGEGRRVAVQPFDGHSSDLYPVPSNENGHDSSFYVLTTPAVFDEFGCPACLRQRIVSAAVPGAIPVSGWDLARGGPKPSRHAAPAGSVYFIRGSLTSHPKSLADRAFDRQQGWGCYLRGVWRDGYRND